jgi:membrane associated rhomboid family serine protease/Flp pilus assembly protein TadD
MILPLTHERMTVQRLPWVTIVIIALNFAVFLLTWPRALSDYARMDEVMMEIEAYAADHPNLPESVDLQSLLARWDEVQSRHIFSRYGYVPARPSPTGLVGTIFLHAGWMHLLGNMYLLWLCGCSIEDLWGRPLYAAVYLLGGAGAALAHASLQPDSTAHLVGASGAIAALMGVFCVRCWNTNVRFFYWFFVAFMGTFTAPAWIMLLLWLTRELFSAFVYADSSSVAFWAHIGGFGFGAAVAFAMKLSRLEERVIAPAIDRKTNLVAKHPRFVTALEHFDRGDYGAAVRELKIAVEDESDDPDLHQWLGRSYQALGRPLDAAGSLRRELALHLKRRELELAAQSYLELVAAAPDFALTARELAAVASALMASGYEPEAAALFQKLLSDESDPLLRLRAGLALASYHHQQGRTRQGLSVLEELSTLAAAHPEWQSSIDEKRQALLAAR